MKNSIDKYPLQLVKFGFVISTALVISSCGGEGAVIFDDLESAATPTAVVTSEGSSGATQDDAAEGDSTEPSPAPVSPSTEESEPEVVVAPIAAPTTEETPPAPQEQAGDSNSGAVSTSQSAAVLLENAARDGDIRVMPVGDSITQGVGGTSGYRGHLEDLLAQSGCPFRMVGTQSQTLHESSYYAPHEAYSGLTADGFLEGNGRSIAEATINQKPDVILLHVGSVDIFQGQSVASTIADIDQIIANIADAKPDTAILVANLVPIYGEENVVFNTGLAQVSQGIEALVNESNYNQVAMVDVRAGYTADMMRFDKTIPNETGNAHMAAAFYNKIHSTDYCQQ